jgi:TPP-dependent pyruvate/acetoin dehydrogenase alpha subunit
MEKKITSLEHVSALVEEQALTKKDLLTYLRQVMEIRAFEDNISDLSGSRSIERCLAPLCR